MPVVEMIFDVAGHYGGGDASAGDCSRSRSCAVGSNVNRAVMTYRHIDWPVIFVLSREWWPVPLWRRYFWSSCRRICCNSASPHLFCTCAGAKLPKLALEKREFFCRDNHLLYRDVCRGKWPRWWRPLSNSCIRSVLERWRPLLWQ